MKGYTQLTREQRYQIYVLWKNGFKQSDIARQIGVHKSTISRELKRNSQISGDYIPARAHKLSQKRKSRRLRTTIPVALWRKVRRMLRQDWSPEQICLWLRDNEERSISHEWIYQMIYRNKRNGGDLFRHLRCKCKRRKRYASYTKRGKIVNSVSIDERPDVVDERARFGDWEADLVEGNRSSKHALLTLTERVARYTLVAKVESKHSAHIAETMINLLSTSGLAVETVTSDNGREFADHESVSDALGIDFYFAHPYSPWERGGNENTNGLLRQYAPKKSDMSQLSEDDIDQAMQRLNNRPRKCLGMKTPNQVLFGLDPTVALTT